MTKLPETEHPTAAPTDASRPVTTPILVEEGRSMVSFVVDDKVKEAQPQPILSSAVREQAVASPAVPENAVVSNVVPLPLSESQIATAEPAVKAPELVTKSPVVPRPRAANQMVYELTPEQSDLLAIIEKRLKERPRHYRRPKGINFVEVKEALVANPALMRVLSKMESTGGEPDIIKVDENKFTFADCSSRPPFGRRNKTYDQSLAAATTFGVTRIMNKDDYFDFQKEGTFDILNHWVWVETPAEIRNDGHALHGYRDGVAEVSRRGAMYHDERGSWRGILEVPRA